MGNPEIVVGKGSMVRTIPFEEIQNFRRCHFATLFLISFADLNISYIVAGRSPTMSNFIILFFALDSSPGLFV